MKKTGKKFFPLLIFTIIFCSAIYGIFHLYVSDRPSAATAEQVKTVLSQQGLQPVDITDTAIENFSGAGLENCIIAEQDDIRFEFYRFDNVDSARKVYRQAYTKIIGNKTSQRVQFEERKLNYHIYILDNETDYYLSLYVENTAVYAYCSSENSAKVNSLLDSLEYMAADGDDWNSESPFDRIIRVAAYALWIPIMYITRIWIWPVVCKSAGITHQKAVELGDSRKEIIPKLIHRSKKPKQTKIFALIHSYISLPAYIATLITIIGCFTDKLDNIIATFGILIPIIMVCCIVVFIIINRAIKPVDHQDKTPR